MDRTAQLLVEDRIAERRSEATRSRIAHQVAASSTRTIDDSRSQTGVLSAVLRFASDAIDDHPFGVQPTLHDYPY